jgi:AN1-like zinc finger protein
MAKTCGFCNKLLHWPAIYSCYYCQKVYCDKHRLAENHNCPKVMAAKHIEKDWLRKKGVNISSGKYAAVCKQCGFTSDYFDIEQANQVRINHMKSSGCVPAQVQLRQDEGTRKEDEQIIKKSQTSDSAKTGEWMHQSLTAAKGVIKTHHLYCDCDTEAFFRKTTFDLYIQDDRPNAYAYINMSRGSTHFPIGVHPALSEQTTYNQRALVVVLVHELLHALHPDWGHDKINPQERLLANKAGYYDALIELERIAISGKMRLCNS